MMESIPTIIKFSALLLLTFISLSFTLYSNHSCDYLAIDAKYPTGEVYQILSRGIWRGEVVQILDLTDHEFLRVCQAYRRKNVGKNENDGSTMVSDPLWIIARVCSVAADIVGICLAIAIGCYHFFPDGNRVRKRMGIALACLSLLCAVCEAATFTFLYSDACLTFVKDEYDNFDISIPTVCRLGVGSYFAGVGSMLWMGVGLGVIFLLCEKDGVDGEDVSEGEPLQMPLIMNLENDLIC